MTRRPQNTFDNHLVFDHIWEKARAQGMAHLNHISNRIGISPTLLGDIRTGSCNLQFSHRKTLEKIARYLGVSVGQVYAWSGVKSKKSVPELSQSARYIIYMREKLGMTKRDASAYFGLGKNAFIDYELDQRKASLLLMLILKVLEDHPELIRVVNNLVLNPDPKQAHPTYFSYMRRKLKLGKRDAAHIFGLGKGTFTQIEYGIRQPSTLLLIMFKLIELKPAIFEKVRQLSAGAELASHQTD